MRSTVVRDALVAVLVLVYAMQIAGTRSGPIAESAHRYWPNVRWTPGHLPLEVVAQGTILKLAQVTARW